MRYRNVTPADIDRLFRRTRRKRRVEFTSARSVDPAPPDRTLEWHGLTVHWWILTVYGPMAISSQLAAEWMLKHRIMLGTYEDARAVCFGPREVEKVA